MVCVVGVGVLNMLNTSFKPFLFNHLTRKGTLFSLNVSIQYWEI